MNKKERTRIFNKLRKNNQVREAARRLLVHEATLRYWLKAGFPKHRDREEMLFRVVLDGLSAGPPAITEAMVTNEKDIEIAPSPSPEETPPA